MPITLGRRQNTTTTISPPAQKANRPKGGRRTKKTEAELARVLFPSFSSTPLLSFDFVRNKGVKGVLKSTYLRLPDSALSFKGDGVGCMEFRRMVLAPNLFLLFLSFLSCTFLFSSLSAVGVLSSRIDSPLSRTISPVFSPNHPPHTPPPSSSSLSFHFHNIFKVKPPRTSQKNHSSLREVGFLPVARAFVPLFSPSLFYLIDKS